MGAAVEPHFGATSLTLTIQVEPMLLCFCYLYSRTYQHARTSALLVFHVLM